MLADARATTKTSRWARVASAITAVALCMTLTPAADAAAPTGRINGTVTYNGAAATGGCVVLHGADYATLTSDCTLPGGAYEFTGLADGTYYVEFTNFDGAANAWWPAGGTTELAIVISHGNVAERNATLAKGGSLSGSATFGDSARLWTLDGRHLQNVDIVGGAFTFTHVPAGTYMVSIHREASGIDQFYRTSLTKTPTRYTLPASGSTWSINLGAYAGTLATGGSMGGYLNTPRTFTSSTSCAVAVDGLTETVLSVYCGPKGSWFELEGIPTNNEFYLAFTDGDLSRTGTAWLTSSKTAWYGNLDFRDAVVPLSLANNEWYYLSVFFFKDVDAFYSHYYEVQWMGDTGLSTGYADGTYKPSSSILRQHMAAFLYRFAGSPAVKLPAKSPFSDVKVSAQFYKEMVWLKQQGLTTMTKFNPNGNVTRRQMALFLYRLAGEPKVTLPSKSPFKDVTKTDTGYKAIVWMEQTGLSLGYGSGANRTFKPASAVKRGDMAAFIYRYAHELG